MFWRPLQRATRSWRVHGDAVKARCTLDYIVEMDMLGFLGADMYGPGPLLHAEDANRLGKQIQTLATRADAAR